MHIHDFLAELQLVLCLSGAYPCLWVPQVHEKGKLELVVHWNPVIRMEGIVRPQPNFLMKVCD
jgi:hypothetical protein